ncbi:hypothetical protein [Aureispira anguillae]|uniref:DNA primase n=1 Tax=Aureispira anguillae TaxID=2864201 RepID=A0A915YCQ7_9BACT|nr:hypothetical protein [Aureispira anguillae]BDS10666.1 hypothetical protein AsAng_0013750 [Aureispira anguillae]BDS10672.1 hypothetical protein AsAng_0013810 [Aureispira anguillae]
MTKQELERYLEIETILKLHKIAIDKEGFMSCPFHSNCERSLKLYPELNGVACMRESCSKYRKVLDAFSILQELEGIKTEEARLYGKSLLLRELESYRARKTPVKVQEIGENRSLNKREAVLLKYFEDLKRFVLEKGGGEQGYEFRLGEVREDLKVYKSTQQRYIHELLEKGYIEQSSGSSNRGYYYRILNWAGR